MCFEPATPVRGQYQSPLMCHRGRRETVAKPGGIAKLAAPMGTGSGGG